MNRTETKARENISPGSFVLLNSTWITIHVFQYKANTVVSPEISVLRVCKQVVCCSIEFLNNRKLILVNGKSIGSVELVPTKLTFANGANSQHYQQRLSKFKLNSLRYIFNGRSPNIIYRCFGFPASPHS